MNSEEIDARDQTITLQAEEISRLSGLVEQLEASNRMLEGLARRSAATASISTSPLKRAEPERDGQGEVEALRERLKQAEREREITEARHVREINALQMRFSQEIFISRRGAEQLIKAQQPPQRPKATKAQFFK
jgi:hypothetical protein